MEKYLVHTYEKTFGIEMINFIEGDYIEAYEYYISSSDKILADNPALRDILWEETIDYTESIGRDDLADHYYEEMVTEDIDVEIVRLKDEVNLSELPNMNLTPTEYIQKFKY